MLTTIGVVLDATNPAGCPDAATLPFKAARLTAFDDARLYTYAAQFHAAGVRLTYAMPPETFGGRDYALVTRAIVRQLPPGGIYLVGNEYDAPPLYMAPGEYQFMWGRVVNEIRLADPTAKAVMGGLVSGQVSAAETYLAGALASGITPDGISLHPYGGDAASTAKYIAAVQVASGLTVYVDEWNRRAVEIPDYCAMLARLGVPVATYFCWSNGMVNTFGLLTADGLKTAEYDALLRVTQGETTMANTEIDKLIAKEPTRVGTVYKRGVIPTGLQSNGMFPAGTEYAYCDGGMMLAVPGVPGAYLLSDVTLLPKA